MSLHAILEVIRETARRQVEQIEAASYAQAGEILANARAEAEAAKEQACMAASEPGYKERSRLLHRARLEALQVLGDVRDGLVDSTLEQTAGRLASLRSTPAYREILRRLLVEAIEELQASHAGRSGDPGDGAGWLEADGRDRVILESLAKELDLHLPVRYCLDCWGGVVVSSEDGRIVVINTLEARYERALPYLRRSLAALFEEGLPERAGAGL